MAAFGRRLSARLDAAKAIKAVAHKLARMSYRMLKYGQEHRDAGERYYEEKYQHHLVRRLHKQAAALASNSFLNRILWQLFLRSDVGIST